MSSSVRSVARPRDRILGAARELFQRHGLRGVGVDAIAEAADSNKMTLYRHFGSKDDLIVACIRKAAQEIEAVWSGIEATHPGDPKAQLAYWVKCTGEYVTANDCHCELTDAAGQLVESDHPARAVIKEFKKEQLHRLTRLCRDTGAVEAELLADALTLLAEGARANWQGTGSEGANVRFVRIAEATIKSFAVTSMPETPQRM